MSIAKKLRIVRDLAAASGILGMVFTAVDSDPPKPRIPGFNPGASLEQAPAGKATPAVLASEAQYRPRI